MSDASSSSGNHLHPNSLIVHFEGKVSTLKKLPLRYLQNSFLFLFISFTTDLRYWSICKGSSRWWRSFTEKSGKRYYWGWARQTLLSHPLFLSNSFIHFRYYSISQHISLFLILFAENWKLCKRTMENRMASEGKVFFESVLPFASIPENGQIKTKPFLEAAKFIVEFVDLLGTTFKPVKSDINGNITKLTTLFESDEAKFEVSLRTLIWKLNSFDHF